MAKKNIDLKRILKLFYDLPHPLTLKDIYKRFSPSRKEKNKIKGILEKLEQQGKIISFRHGRAYGLVKKMELIKGTIELHFDGYGFLIPDDKRRKDIYISRDNLKDAWHKDEVIVALLPYQRGKSPEGRVVKVVKREIEEIPVLLAKKLTNKVYMAKPADSKLPFDFIVDLTEIGDSSNVHEGCVAIIKPHEFYEKNVFFAKGIRVLGKLDEIKVQEEIVKIFHSIPREFPPEVLEEAKKILNKVSPSEIKCRRDLRDLNFVTIDGKNARDFDDAIYVQEMGKGYKLFVAIADVTHYVKVGSALDKEARDRGNSYYFPTSVEPMFPPRLSNYICSLNPGEDRLTIVAEMDFNRVGRMKNAKFYGAIIKSKKRLTYSQVESAIVDNNKEAQQGLGQDILFMLNSAKELAKILYKKREARGAIDFDIPEPEVIFQDFEEKELKCMQIKPRSRYFAHQIIEEFMIAANEAVANFLAQNELPCMYRIHPEPDQEKIDNLFTILETTEIGDKLPQDIDSRAIQGLLKKVKGKEYEFLVNRLLLRSMMQAVYSPENKGHFGLASECYCHFTSPIRRYADIIVHRILKQYLGIEKYRFLKEKRMKKLGEHLSNRERVALTCEREILKRLTVLLMQDRIGEVFTGIISSVTDFGFWVEIKDMMAEGLVRLSTILDDYYLFDHIYQRLIGKRHGRIFQIGDTVEVRLINVNLDKQEIDFELVDMKNH